MFFQKTRDLIVETATIVKGVKDSQEELQRDFKNHVTNEEKRTVRLYDTIKECHENCSESDRFNKYIKDANGTLKRIEDKYDDKYKEDNLTKLKVEKRHEDYTDKLQAIKDEVKGMKQAKKTFRQVMADIGKIIGCVVVVAGLIFGIVQYCEARKTKEDVKIEKLLEEIIKEQKIVREIK